MKYCIRCLYPASKPDLFFDQNGLCSACAAFEARKGINWDKREHEFKELVSSVKGKASYDCIVPVSGGKDSHWQVMMALRHGLKPLAVTAYTDSLSPLGRHNLDNISRLGVDHIEIKANPIIRRKINKLTLTLIGDISWAEHITIFTIPVIEAVQRQIPMILWGENPQNEYGGPEASQAVRTLDQQWLQEFGGLNGLRVSDVADTLGLHASDLFQYQYPNDDKLKGIMPVFLGQYFPWDGEFNAYFAREHGFLFYDKIVEGSLCKYENLDNYQTGIHDYFKYLKFGFGRATDIACNMIRRGNWSRGQALRMVLEYDGKYPKTYLDKPLTEILKEINMSEKEFEACCYNFSNKELFQVQSDPGHFNPIRKFEVT